MRRVNSSAEKKLELIFLVQPSISHAFTLLGNARTRVWMWDSWLHAFPWTLSAYYLIQIIAYIGLCGMKNCYDFNIYVEDAISHVQSLKGNELYYTIRNFPLPTSLHWFIGGEKLLQYQYDY
jgi:hypothetical protein